MTKDPGIGPEPPQRKRESTFPKKFERKKYKKQKFTQAKKDVNSLQSHIFAQFSE
jgi:hypothetical protein